MKTEFKGASLSVLIIASIMALAIPFLSPSPAHAALTPHAPIYINGNNNFIPANGVTSGSGTENDPYIIENWIIGGGGGYGCIHVVSTTAYFVIRNCLLENQWYADIYFESVINARIENNSLRNSQEGIDLTNSSNNLIKNNNIKNNDLGIGLWYYSNSNIVSNNNICDSGLTGIHLTLVSNNLVENNLVENDSCGIRLYFINRNNLILRNIVENNSQYGIRVDNLYDYGYSRNNLFYNNNLLNNVNQADDDGFNFWNDGYPSGGNYWSDYTGTDNYRGENQDMPGSDGVGDLPYNITGGGNVDHYPLMSPVVNGLIYRPPIYIDGDDDFIPANGVMGGSGTENNPYIIKNWIINASTAHGIEVRSTTAYFVIRNCMVKGEGGTYYGIYFDNVRNEKIENTTCKDGDLGIYLRNSSNNSLNNNICSGNSRLGILLENSSNNTFSNDTCENNTLGIQLSNSHNNILDNNTCSNNDGYGIYLYYSYNNTLTNNACGSNDFGIDIEHSGNNFVLNNIVENNWGSGIRLFLSDNILVVNNALGNNFYDGIDISSSNNIVSNNIMENNQNGIRLVGSNNFLYSNICSNNNEYGIRLEGLNNTLDNNVCSNNFLFGIYLTSSDNNTLTNNMCDNNGSYGIILGYSSNNNRIYHNNFINNSTQAYDVKTNYWDNGYPSGGNYWSDYVGADNYQGKNQDIPGSDGIGDTPYYISGDNNLDRYPLMSPVVGGLISRPPIYIDGNDNFTPANGVVSGSGTENDPHIIGNWAISAENANGIEIRNTTAYFVIRNCYVHDGRSNNYYGISFDNVTNGKIDKCITENNREGIYLYYYSDNNLISNNTAKNNGYGIHLHSSSNCTLDNNTCSNNAFGIYLYYSSDNNTLENNTCSNNGYGIYLYSSSNCTLDNNTCSNNAFGIYLYYSSDNNTLENNTCSNNTYGIFLRENSDNNTLDNNTCSNNSSGIRLEISSNNTLANNTCENNNDYGIFLHHSSDCNILGNTTCSNDTYGIYLESSSDNNTLTNNTCSNNYCGVRLHYSSNNTLKNNTCENNPYYGIYLYSSSNCTLDNNTCFNNSWGGIYLYLSSYDNLTNNTCSNNSPYGIHLESSSNCIICHNNFLNNVTQACDDGSNYWDNGYPSGGNYWSDYTGADNYRGENQDIPGSDGIGDTPYYIPGDSNRDRYPLMSQIVGAYTMEVLLGTTIVDGRVETDTAVVITSNQEEGLVTVVKYENNPGGSPPSGFTALGKYIEVRTDIPSENIVWPIEIRIYYTDEEVVEARILENSLKIFYWDGSNWVQEPDSGVNTENNYVWARVSHLSPFAPIEVIIRSVEISIWPSYQGGLPWTTLNYVVTVKNTGDVEDNYVLTVSDNSGWSPTLDNDWLLIPAGENRTTALKVTVPENAENCTRDNIVIVATSVADNTIKDNDSCIAHAVMTPWTGTATFRLENLYAIYLEMNLALYQGSKLVVKFYTYENVFENEDVIHVFTPPWQVVPENENVAHPREAEGFPWGTVQIARLVLTTDNTEEVISTIASFTVHQSHLRDRTKAILKDWGGHPELWDAFRAEVKDILKQWGSAPP